MIDPSPRLNMILPLPEGVRAAAYVMRRLTARISLVFGNIGISAVVAATVASEPNRTYARAVVVFVTTTVSPPPISGMLEDVEPLVTETVPVGRKGLTEPSGMSVTRFTRYAQQ